MVTEEQRKRPRPWALALGMIAVAIVPLLAVAAMASGDDSSQDCADVARDETAFLKRVVLDTLPANSTRNVTSSSAYVDECALGAIEVQAAWAQTTGATVVRTLQAQGWTMTDTGADEADWFQFDHAPSGAAGTTADNESPNVALTRTVENRTVDVGVDAEGLQVVLARAGGS
ncbi:MAG: hypothetical protein ACT4QG_14925 [Sporichthyaceae bacterium]